MVTPAQKPHRSVQEVETPPELIAAIESRFGKIDFDLAASSSNAKAARFFTKEDDSLSQSWRLEGVRVAWLNCEFGDAKPYAKKCSEVRYLRRWTLLLVPMGTQDWACEHVWRKAFVLKLKGRVKFVNHKQGFPKDLILAAYGFGLSGEEVWDWRADYSWTPSPFAEATT